MPVSPPFVPTIENWNSTVPPAPVGQQNVIFQADPPNANPRRKSAYLPVFVGDSGTGGLAGSVPAPPPGSAAAGDFLWAGGTWASPGISGLFVTPVSGGGTGETNLTAHAVLLGEGILPIGFAVPSTSGWVLTSNGAGVDPSFQAPAGASGGCGCPVMVGDSGSGGVQGLVPAPPAGSAALNEFLNANGTFTTVPGTPGGGPGAGFAYGGDGSDGALVFNGTTNPVAGATLSGSTYTMTRDIFATTFKVNSGITVLTANYTIHASTSVTIFGTVDNSGQLGTSGGANNAGLDTSAPGIQGGAGTYPMPVMQGSSTNRSQGGGGVQGSGATGAGGNASAGGTGGAAANAIRTTQYAPATWKGGNGGSVGGNAGGTGASNGAAGNNTTTNSQPRTAPRAYGYGGVAISTASFGFIAYSIGNGVGGAGGGGGGAGDGTNAGANGGGPGSGGGTGGFIGIFTPVLIVSGGIISSNGANGTAGQNGINAVGAGNRGGGGGGAGGAGGSGGIIFLVCHSLTNTGTISVSAGTGGGGGTGGTGTGTGGAGANGAAGPNGTTGLIITIAT